VKTADQFVEDYLSKQVHFFQVAGQLACNIGSRRESILGVSESLMRAVVTTSGSGAGYRRRYILARKRDSWILKGLQKECGVCFMNAQFTGKATNESCEYCQGTGWCSLE
jgi:uncharacterized UPF0160 family protein